MKLSFSTLPCAEWSAEKLISVCRTEGYAGVELREDPACWVNVHMEKAERKRIKERFEHGGIRVTNIGSSICLNGMDGKALQSQIEQFKKLTELAEGLGALGIRIFPGNFVQRKDEKTAGIDEERMVQWLIEAGEFAKPYGIQLWVETHNEYATGKTVSQLLRQINLDNCGAIWDILHPIEEGEQPEETQKYLNEKCRHVHIKDATPWDDPLLANWKYTRIGEGSLPIADCIIILVRNGYQGFYSLEWETKWRPELRIPNTDPEFVLPFYARYMNQVFQTIGEKEQNI